MNKVPDAKQRREQQLVLIWVLLYVEAWLVAFAIYLGTHR